MSGPALTTVVRRDDLWRLTTVPGEGDTIVDLDAVLAAVDASTEPPGPSTPFAPPALGPDVVVAPSWIVTGTVTSGGISTCSHDGAPHLLDRDDILAP